MPLFYGHTYEEPPVQEEAVINKPSMCYVISSAMQYGALNVVSHGNNDLVDRLAKTAAVEDGPVV